jgi:hypothetical protein
VTVVARLDMPAIEILGGHPFFLPKAGDEPIPGPVFPRGRGAGPIVRIQACCTRKVVAWIADGGGKHVADLVLDQLYPGYYQAIWPWSSAQGWAVPDGIPTGEYRVHVRSECQERDGVASFFVIFDPAAVAGPPRFSFDDIAVWFYARDNHIWGLHYYLRCSDWRVFRIAIQACAGHTDPYAAAIALARAEEALFKYRLVSYTNDVADLIANYREAQCADDAACLTALMRASGIPAHPVTADAALETKAAIWTFDTWIEFLARHDGVAEWRCLHPHEYPGMEPESRAAFGTRGAASKAVNDLVVMANENWPLAELDGLNVSDASFDRNQCGKPNQVIAKPPWIDELCEAGYWASPHWDCTGVRPQGLIAGDGFQIAGGEPEWGGHVRGLVHLVNPLDRRVRGLLSVDLVIDRPESKAFGEIRRDTVGAAVTVAPGKPVALSFDLTLPRTVEPGRDLYLRARLDERTILVHRLRPPSPLEARAEMAKSWRVGEEGPLRIVLCNTGKAALRSVEIAIRAPYALRVEPHSVRIGTLKPGETREVTAQLKAVAPLASGSLHVAVATANGGGALLRNAFRIADCAHPAEARPALLRPAPNAGKPAKGR